MGFLQTKHSEDNPPPNTKGTMLFTDTKEWQELANKYTDAMKEARKIWDQADKIARNNGMVISQTGETLHIIETVKNEAIRKERLESGTYS